MFDAIIIGSGVAGAPTALLTARAAHKILLINKPRPADDPSTEILWTYAVAKLDRWGLLEEFQALGAPAIRELRVDLDGTVLTGSPAAMAKRSEFYVPRRAPLDAMLTGEAATVGVEVRDDFEVTEIVKSGLRVTGVRGKTPSGQVVEESAQIVVGADGRNSLVSQAVKAAVQDERPAGCAYYYALWSGLDVSTMDVIIRRGSYVSFAPTHSGLTRVTAAWSEDAHPGADFETTYGKLLQSDARAAELVGKGRRETAVMGTGFGEKPFMRKAFGPGWALVGDASYYQNPLMAQGIVSAFRDAELLSMALDETFSGRRAAHDALTDYETFRTEQAMPAYEASATRSLLQGVSPQMQPLLAALPGNQEDTDAFFGTIAGTVAYADFLDPENMKRILNGKGQPAAV